MEDELNLLHDEEMAVVEHSEPKSIPEKVSDTHTSKTKDILTLYTKLPRDSQKVKSLHKIAPTLQQRVRARLPWLNKRASSHQPVRTSGR